MRILNEQKQFLEDLPHLIRKMENEIELLRNINYRYFLKYGEEVKSGVIYTPENVSFDMYGTKEEVKCRIIEHDKLGLTSDYQQIKEQINKWK